MIKQLAKYGTGLIALYVIVANGSAMGQVMSAGASGGTQLIRGLQGR